jgi:hypothetical protein
MTPRQRKEVSRCLDKAIAEIRRWQYGMLGVLALLLAVSLAVSARMFFAPDSKQWTQATFITGLLGICSLCLLYLARMLKCNSGFLVIRCSLILGNPRFLDILKEQLSCFGKFEEVLNDVKRITNQFGGGATPRSDQGSD